jgi:uncharacterized delta-60 repeat protein
MRSSGVGLRTLIVTALVVAQPVLPARAIGLAGGVLDPSFGTAGRVVTSFAGRDSGASAAVVQPDGKIVVAGTAGTLGGDNDFALVRYNADGTLDTMFGARGRVKTDLGGATDVASALLLQQDGKIVAGGRRGGLNEDFALVRYNHDGTMDPSFGRRGKVTTDFSGGGDFITDLVLEPDGKIVAVGVSATKGDPFRSRDFALARFNPDGTLDPSFGAGGRVTTELGRSSSAFAIALQQDGKILVGGSSEGSNGPTDFSIARYNPDGTLDASFGMGSGVVTTDLFGGASFGGDDYLFDLTVQPDGKIVAGGWASRRNSVKGDSALVRYNPNGTLDASFGVGGKITTDLFGGDDSIFSLALQPDGKILAVGPAKRRGGDYDFALARYNPDGTPDPGVGPTGSVRANFRGDSVAYAMALQPDGKIVAAGATYTRSGARYFVLARYQIV